MFTEHFRQFSPRVFGVEVDLAIAARASARIGGIGLAFAETLPFPSESFDVVFSHEVIDHVTDDRAAALEMVRVTAPGGYVVLFAPNRLYPFETHGHYWRGRYHFGNTPLINWLPSALRDRLAPHVRAYTARELRSLFAGNLMHLVHHSVVYPGFDNVVATRPRLGSALRQLLYAAERTPLQAFGLSHFLVLRRKQ
jgi:SAM-dependent methyltransferase